MGLRFVCGRAGTGKSSLCLDEIRQELRRQPWGPPLILLVPEQATYQMEVLLAGTPDLGGSLRAQVLSFRRLAWRVLAETGGGQKVLIGSTGKQMLLRRILLKERYNLKAFASSAARTGTAGLFARAIGELKTYRIKPADIYKVKKSNALLEAKLHDLALIYSEFETALGEKIRDPDDELGILADKIPEADLLKDAQIWVDGFTGFTPSELEVMKKMMSAAREVVLTLPLDPAIFSEESGLFSGSWRTYQELRRLAFESGTSMRPDVLLTEAKRNWHPWLRHVEKYFYSYPTVSYVLRGPETGTAADAETSGEAETKAKAKAEVEAEEVQPVFSLGDGIRIFSAANRRAEVEGAAREIRRLARDYDLAWNNMAIMTRDLTRYHALISQVFSAYEIPYFSDQKRSLLAHPLLELLQALPEIVISNWAYEPIFRALKTGFFPLAGDTVDRLENYVLEHGVQRGAWTGNKDWKYRRQRSLGQDKLQLEAELRLQAELNEGRERVRDLLEGFVRQVSAKDGDGPRTVKKITEALYVCLENLNVPETLQKWTQEEQKEGNLAEAGLHSQAWEAVLQVLDEIVAGLGDTCLDLEEYALILSSGLETVELGLIPPEPDQVLVGSLDRSRNPEIRVLFLLGANEGVLPARPEDNGLFDGEERALLADEGIALASKGKEQINEEQFYIYMALTRATDKLVVSYPLTDEEGKGMTVSTVVARLVGLFSLTDVYWGNQEEMERISQGDFAFQAYAEQIRTLRRGEKLSPLWQAAEMWFAQNRKLQSRLRWLRESLFRRNREESIQRPLARRLYGKRLKVSVSRLEQFVKCPFAHYARYGLKLRERPVYRLGSPDVGEFFHDLLRDFANHLQENGLDWGKLTPEESWDLVNELTEQLAPGLQHEILLSSARYRYLTQKLKRTVFHATRVLGEHARKGVFTPIQLEVGFGPEATLPGVDISLSDGDSLLLTGRIDRIDAAFLDGKVFLRILDYKSRELKLGLDSIYYGLSLQLLTYLDVALQGAEVLIEEKPGESAQKIPAGFLYFPVVESRLEEKAPLSPEELEEKRLKAVRVSGYLLADPKVLEAMDSSLADGHSDLLGLRLKQDGSFYKGSTVLTREQFSQLRAHLRQTLARTGESILDGDVSLAPYRRGKDTGCMYCGYQPVCRFDPMLPENRYREFAPLKPEEVWQRLNHGDET